MLKVSKVLILSLVVVSLASAAFATTSRVIALAGTANYINDDADIFRWYGTLPSYSNMVMAEAGQATGGIGPSGNGDLSTAYQALGFTHTWGEDHWLGTWAVFLLYNSIEDMSFYNFNPLSSIGSEGTNSSPTTKFVLSWGNAIEDVLSYGINFTRSDASVETTAGGTNDINYTTIGGGARFDIGEDAYADVAVTFGFAGGDSLGGFEDGKALDLGARLFWEVRDDVTVVPFVGWRTFNFSYEDIPATSGLKSSSDFQAGASLNFDVNTNNMLIFAGELEFVSLEPSKIASGDQSETKVTHLPKLFVALESDVTSWLTTRVGATKTMRKIEDTDATGDELTLTGPSFEGGDFEWSLGAGFHIGEWDVDAVFSHEMPFRLGYWLTGYGVGDLDPPVGRVSATYRF